MKKFNNFSFKGIMFHYFHDNKFFKRSPGSINSKHLEKIILKVGRKNILDPLDFIEKLKNRSIKHNHVCLTFDDTLRCQYKIALPILKKYKIKSFFFVTTSIFTSRPNLIEVYRYFRDNHFRNINQYYIDFNKELKKIYSEKKIITFIKKNNKIIKKKKKLYPFYSLEDIKFREIRDKLLDTKKYDKIMKFMFVKKNFDYKKKIKELYFNKKNLKTISNMGHIIGLHSHSHPYSISKLSYNKQAKEFRTNKKILEKITKKNVISASFPRGDYNATTLKVFNKLGIQIAFRDNELKINKNPKGKNLEIARIDHNKI